jgi:hypothetical protein
MEKFITEDYSMQFDAETATVYCQGIMRLTNKEYKPIIQWLNKIVALGLPKMTLNLRELRILNSSGVAMLGIFVSAVDKKKTVQLVIQCSKKTAWQKKSVNIFQDLMPEVQMEWE